MFEKLELPPHFVVAIDYSASDRVPGRSVPELDLEIHYAVLAERHRFGGLGGICVVILEREYVDLIDRLTPVEVHLNPVRVAIRRLSCHPPPLPQFVPFRSPFITEDSG